MENLEVENLEVESVISVSNAEIKIAEEEKLRKEMEKLEDVDPLGSYIARLFLFSREKEFVPVSKYQPPSRVGSIHSSL